MAGKQFVGIKIFLRKKGGNWDNGTAPDVNFAKKTYEVNWLMCDPNSEYEILPVLYYANDLMSETLQCKGDVYECE